MNTSVMIFYLLIINNCSVSLWRERGVLVGMRISMYQTRDSVNNALYVKAILEQVGTVVIPLKERYSILSILGPETVCLCTKP